ncbi:MAG: Gfo/Idh/MocA family oxidoreductase [Candidatus Nealsonbacteria bacterium]|nr:Gfo/Idh/MocA family oxidoreductase [Candidatus Nealsonbacteria bacterium]
MKPKPNRRTRRNFLKTTGAAVAIPYAISSASLGAGTSRPASERITTALIGSGARGNQIIVGGDKVVAVCDVDSVNRAKTKAAIDKKSRSTSCKSYNDFRDVLARDDIDAVVVATPDHWHATIAAAAIRAGKAVYVEKPLSAYIDEGRRLADVVKRYGAILQVGSQQRSPEYGQFARACELVRNGRIGELKTVEVDIYARPGKADPWKPQPVPAGFDYDMWLGPAPWSPYHKDRCHYNFRFVSDCSGGDVTNWGAHHLDIAQWGVGADGSGPVEVVGSGKRNASGLHDTFYDIKVDFTYANGVTVKLRSGGKEMKTGGLRFVGSEGWIRVTRERMVTSPTSLATSRIAPDEIHLATKSEATTHMGIWLDCIREGNRRGLNAPVEIGHRSATVCHLANIVMELNRKLEWDPEAEQFVDDDQANRMANRPARSPWRI